MDFLGYHCLWTSHVRILEKSQLSNHLWIPLSPLSCLSQSQSLWLTVSTGALFFWNQSPEESACSVPLLNRASGDLGHRTGWTHTSQCGTGMLHRVDAEGNRGLCFHLVSGSLMFTWCPSCTLTFTCPSLACAALPCQLPSPGGLIVQCPFLFSLSLFGCTALCNSVGLPLSGLFFSRFLPFVHRCA